MLHAPLVLLLIAQPIAKKAAPSPPRPAAAASLNDDQILKNVALDVTGPSLTTFFRQRMMPNVEAEHMAKLAKQLSDNSEQVHNKACKRLRAPVDRPWFRALYAR